MTPPEPVVPASVVIAVIALAVFVVGALLAAAPAVFVALVAGLIALAAGAAQVAHLLVRVVERRGPRFPGRHHRRPATSTEGEPHP